MYVKASWCHVVPGGVCQLWVGGSIPNSGEGTALPADHLRSLDATLCSPRLNSFDRPGSVAIRTSFRAFFSVRAVGAVAIEMEGSVLQQCSPHSPPLTHPPLSIHSSTLTLLRTCARKGSGLDWLRCDRTILWCAITRVVRGWGELQMAIWFYDPIWEGRSHLSFPCWWQSILHSLPLSGFSRSRHVANHADTCYTSHKQGREREAHETAWRTNRTR